MKRAPTSADWIYELKMDGYRLMVRRHEDKVRIYSRRGADFTLRSGFTGSLSLRVSYMGPLSPSG